MAEKTKSQEVEECITEIGNLNLDLIDISKKISENKDLKDVEEFDDLYIKIYSKINKTSSLLFSFDPKKTNPLWDTFEQCVYDFNYIYDSAQVYINRSIIQKTNDLQNEAQKSKGIDLAVFSIVLTILAFVLTNAKYLAADQISFRNVILVNLSFILAATILFTFVSFFWGVHNYGRNRKTKILLLVAIYVVLIVGIVLIAIFMK